ncbi:MAG: DinB family protein [Candidatus Hodarchaeota archaeon]
MQDQLIKAISSGFYGEWIHIDPKYALIGLTPSNALKKPDGGPHSCWELLHHIVIWQDSIIRHIQGETLDWNEIEANDNWPTIESMKDDSNFDTLLDRFYSNVEKATKLLTNVDFLKTSEGFPELSTIKLYMVLLQHTSYHIGQIITVRQCIGDSPKPPS